MTLSVKKCHIRLNQTISIGGAVCGVVIGYKNGLEKAALVSYDMILLGCDLRCNFGVLECIAILMYHYLNPAETTSSIKTLRKVTSPPGHG